MSAPQPVRNQDGTFRPGVSGNPGGKPKGCRARKVVLRDALMALGNAARDPAAARRVLDALQPPSSPMPSPTMLASPPINPS